MPTPALSTDRDGGLRRSLGWYGLAEIAVRLVRIATTVVLARLLLAADFGIIAIVTTAFELIRVIGANGTALMIVRAQEADLARTTATAFRVAVAATFVMMVLCLAVGLAFAYAMDMPAMLGLMAVLAVSLVAQSAADVAYGRLMRVDRARTIGLVTAAGVVLEGLATIAFALAGFGVWSVVLAKLAATPLYAAMLVRAAGGLGLAPVASLPWREVARFSLPLVGAEALAAVRAHVDKVLVGAMLGVETLGIYAFAFNAGVGLSLAFTAALSTSLYPHFATLASRPAELDARYDAAMRSTVWPMAGLIALQAAAAHVYVPLVFGARWTEAAPLVAILCLGAATRPICDAARQYLRAEGRTAEEFAGALVLTAATLSAFAAALPFGLIAASSALALASTAGHLGFAYWARRRPAKPATEQPA
jgi:PST family polysaccharide transporter